MPEIKKLQVPTNQLRVGDVVIYGDRNRRVTGLASYASERSRVQMTVGIDNSPVQARQDFTWEVEREVATDREILDDRIASLVSDIRDTAGYDGYEAMTESLEKYRNNVRSGLGWYAWNVMVNEAKAQFAKVFVHIIDTPEILERVGGLEAAILEWHEELVSEVIRGASHSGGGSPMHALAEQSTTAGAAAWLGEWNLRHVVTRINETRKEA